MPGRVTVRGERPIKFRNIWFSTKAILVASTINKLKGRVLFGRVMNSTNCSWEFIITEPGKLRIFNFMFSAVRRWMRRPIVKRETAQIFNLDL